MENCLTYDQSFARVCNIGMPGIRELILINADNIDSVTYDTTMDFVTNITVTTYGIDLLPPPYTSGAGFKIALHRGSSTAMDEMQITTENGTAMHKHSVQFKIAGMNKNTVKAFKQLSQAYVVAIVKDNKDQYHLLGYPGGLMMESGVYQFGTGETDFAGAEITLSGFNSERIFPIDETFDIESIIAVPDIPDIP